MYEKQMIGKTGEKLVCNYLEKNNYNIIDRNFKCIQGELDIIAYDINKKELVFIEVKTRTSFNYGIPSEAVNKRKQVHIINSIKYYLYCKKMENIYIRIDVVEVVFYNGIYKINHIFNAF